MTVFFERLMGILDEERVRKVDVTNALGYKEPHFASWKKGSIPRRDTINKLADFLNVSPDYLLGLTDDRYAVRPESIPVYEIGKARKIPLFSTIPDSDDIFSEEKYIDDFVYCTDSMRTDENLFAMVAINNSMTPIVEVGDTMIAQYTELCENGDMCLYKIFGDVGLRWYRETEDGIELIPKNLYDEDNNPRGFKKIFISTDKIVDFDFSIIGKVLEVRKRKSNLTCKFD